MVTTKVVKITGQGREATNFPYLDNLGDGDVFHDEDGDDDNACDDDGDTGGCVFATSF